MGKQVRKLSIRSKDSLTNSLRNLRAISQKFARPEQKTKNPNPLCRAPGSRDGVAFVNFPFQCRIAWIQEEVWFFLPSQNPIQLTPVRQCSPLRFMKWHQCTDVPSLGSATLPRILSVGVGSHPCCPCKYGHTSPAILGATALTNQVAAKSHANS